MECGVRVILGLSSLYFAEANIEQQARNHRAAAACYVCMSYKSTAGDGTQGRGTQQSTHALTALHLRHHAERNLPVLFVHVSTS